MNLSEFEKLSTEQKKFMDELIEKSGLPENLLQKLQTVGVKQVKQIFNLPRWHWLDVGVQNAGILKIPNWGKKRQSELVAFLATKGLKLSDPDTDEEM